MSCKIMVVWIMWCLCSNSSNGFPFSSVKSNVLPWPTSPRWSSHNFPCHQPPWPPPCGSHTPSTFSLQGLCPCSLCLECSSRSTWLSSSLPLSLCTNITLPLGLPAYLTLKDVPPQHNPSFYFVDLLTASCILFAFVYHLFPLATL